MGFGATKTSTPKATGNIDKDSLNSNQETPPVPYICGRNRIPLTWITPCYNRQAQQVQSTSGKASGGAGGQYNYYVDFQAAICVTGRAPVTAISAIIVDHVVAWKGNVVRRTGVPYESITVPKYGEIRIYWGNVDQPAQDMFTAHFNATTADDNFDAQPARTDILPPLGGVALFVAKSWFLGSNRTQIQTLEVIVDRPPLWFADQPAPNVTNQGSNWVAVLYEWLVDDYFGMGRPVSILSEAEWVAAYAQAEAAGQHLAPLITDASGFRQVVAQLLEYFDGWLRRNGATLEVGFWVHGDTDTSGLPVVDDTVLDGEPELTPSGYQDTINQVNVGFRDNTRYWNDAGTQPAVFPGNLRIVGQRNQAQLDRPWIIDAAQALAYAIEWGNLQSQPSCDGTIKVKREYVTAYGIQPGDHISLDSGALGLAIVCRVTEANHPADRDGAIELTVESERGLYPSVYRPTPPARVPDFLVIAAQVVHARVVTLPSGLKDGALAEIGILAERPDPTLTGFRLWLSRDGASYDQLVPDCGWSIRGVLAAGYAADTDPTDESVGLTITMDGPDEDLVVSQSDAQRDGNTLLLWVDDEIFSVGEVTAQGNGEYQVFVSRARYGTLQAAHAVGAEAWFVFRAQMPIAEQEGTIAAGADLFVKLVTHNATEEQALADALAVQFVVAAGSAVNTPGAFVVQTDVEVGTDSKLYSHLHVHWTSPADAAITSWEVRYRPASGTDADWTSVPASSPEADILVQPGVAFLVQVRAFSTFGEPSAWTASVAITSAKAAPFIVTGLALKDGKTANVYKGRHAKFTWRVGNSPVQSTGIGDEPNGLTDGTEDPLLQGYECGVFDVPGSGEQTWSHLRGKRAAQATFTEEENIEAFGAYRSGFRVGVRALDTSGGTSPWSYLDVSKGPPAAPSALIVAHTALHTNHLLWVPAKGTDLNLTHIWFTTDGSGFANATEAGHVGENVAVFTHAGLGATKKASYWVQHENVEGVLGEPYPPRDQPGIAVEMGGLVLGSGATQLNADADGNLWVGAGDFDDSPVRFAADGSVLISGTGNNSIDIGAISTVVKSPKITPASTTFSGSLVLTLTSKTPGSQGIYTTDGSTPTLKNGTVVANGATITITGTTTVQAIGLKLGQLSTDGGGTAPSNLRVQTYTLDGSACSDPAFWPPGGTFNAAQFPQAVTITCPTAGAAIYYSFDHLPANAGDGTLYAGVPVPVPSGATLYARAFADGLTTGAGLAQAYTPFSDPWNGGTAPVGGYTPTLQN